MITLYPFHQTTDKSSNNTHHAIFYTHDMMYALIQAIIQIIFVTRNEIKCKVRAQ
jgi:hypothetical protein